MKTIAFFIMMLMPTMLFMSCFEEKAEVRFNISVFTDKGQSVNEALIKIDGEQIGKTDVNGVWQGDVPLPIGSNKKMEIMKPSNEYYYAMDTKEFVVEGIENHQVIEYKSILYSVPKPSKDEHLTSQTDIPQEILKEETVSKETEVASTEKKEEPPEDDIPAIDEAVKPEKQAASVATNEELVETDLSDQSKQEVEAKIENTPTTIAVEPEPTKQIKNPEIAKENTQVIYTVYAKDKKNFLANASVYYGNEGDFQKGCETNPRGRCVLRFAELPKSPLTVMVKKDGYVTSSRLIRIKDKGIANFSLLVGETIDIFALTKTFNFQKGLQGIEVIINGKMVGKTDKFGQFSYTFQGNKGDLLELMLKSDNHLPEEYQSDFVVSGPMTLKKYFTFKAPPVANLVMLNAQPAGKAFSNLEETFSQDLDANLYRAAKQHIYSSQAFNSFPMSSFVRESQDANLPISQILKFGWQNTTLKSKVDAVIQPIIIQGEKQVLELSLIDSEGKVIAAGKEELPRINDSASIQNAISEISKRIMRKFPFEGSVLRKNKEYVVINLGKNSGRMAKVGDSLEVWGVQTGKRGFRKDFRNIGKLKITKVQNQTATAMIIDLAPRSTIERGDLVVLKQAKEKRATVAKQTTKNAYISVINNSGSDKSAISNANVYFNGQWVGATNEAGRIYVNDMEVSGQGMVKVIKHGFSVYSKSINVGSQNFVVNLEQETAFLKIESKPTGAMIKVDGRILGKTPMTSPVPVPSGFLKLELVGIPGYKDFSQVMELSEGTLELSGTRAIELEKDYLTVANDLINRKKYQEAIGRLSLISKDHSDYLIANHKMGEVYLNYLNQPDKAASAFGVVTSDRSVTNFNNKRFIASYINEGIALYQTAESLANNDVAASSAHYSKSVEVFEKVKPYLRFVPKDQYELAIHNVGFYTALGLQRLWKITNEQQYAKLAFRHWKSYIDANSSDSLNKTLEPFIKNAQVYMRQAEVGLENTSTKL